MLVGVYFIFLLYIFSMQPTIERKGLNCVSLNEILAGIRPLLLGLPVATEDVYMQSIGPEKFFNQHNDH